MEEVGDMVMALSENMGTTMKAKRKNGKSRWWI
jgi:hypothetical protein